LDEQKVLIDFKYIDEFGQESRMIKTFDPCIFQCNKNFKILVEEFKIFMTTLGFSNVDRIQIVKND